MIFLGPIYCGYQLVLSLFTSRYRPEMKNANSICSWLECKDTLLPSLIVSPAEVRKGILCLFSETGRLFLPFTEFCQCHGGMVRP